MNDTSKSGRCVSYQIASTDEFVIAEADRRLGDHIKSLSVFNKAIFGGMSHSIQVPILKWQGFFHQSVKYQSPSNKQQKYQFKSTSNQPYLHVWNEPMAGDQDQ